VERLRRSHPDRLEDFDDPAALAQTDIGKRIKEKVLGWQTPPDFSGLLDSMNSIELEILPTYLRDKNEALRVRIAQCIATRPKIATREHVLPVILKNEDERVVPYLLTALSVESAHYELPSATAAFLRDWRYDDLNGAIRNAWRNANSAFPRIVAENAIIEAESNVGRSIQGGFLTHAPVTKWIQAGSTAFLDAFDSAEQAVQVYTLERLWNGWKVDSVKSLKRQPFAQSVSEYLVEHPRLVDLLERSNREAYAFYRNWLKSLELDTFFDAFPDNDRFAFWESYLPRITAVRGDREYGRLFLDFGNFGVVEFAEVGNAAYVYPPEHFQYYLERNFRRRDRDPGVVKNQQKAMFRLNHTSNWQSNFRSKLRDYL
jgi:hypothetical protein